MRCNAKILGSIALHSSHLALQRVNICLLRGSGGSMLAVLLIEYLWSLKCLLQTC